MDPMNTWTHPGGAGLGAFVRVEALPGSCLPFTCLSHSAPWLWTGFSQLHCRCPWQTVASHWPQTDFCHVLPPSLGCLGLRLNSRVLRGRMLSARGQGPTLVSTHAGQHGFGGPGRAVWREEMLSTHARTPYRSMAGASGVIRR